MRRALLGVMLFEQATDINFYFGGAINKSNVELGITEKRKRTGSRRTCGASAECRKECEYCILGDLRKQEKQQYMVL
ncbi:hypothetical protein M5E86_08635 [Blautia wexlerae]|nr:hypothetical protein M5E86_08635 [Blautia wexlerae]